MSFHNDWSYLRKKNTTFLKVNVFRYSSKGKEVIKTRVWRFFPPCQAASHLLQILLTDEMWVIDFYVYIYLHCRREFWRV